MDCYAHTYVGIKIDTKKLFSIKKVKTFPHNYGEDFEFDPRSGKRLWREQTVYNREIFKECFSDDEDVKDDEYSLEELTIGQYGIVSLASSYKSSGSAEYVAVMLDASTRSHRSYSAGIQFIGLDPKQFSADYKKFKNQMQKFDLWTDTFGIYNTLFISV